jgi:2-octaprenyl-6-methoxyphenol hydroxylase
MKKIECCDSEPARIILTDGRVLSCQLIVGADGRRSETREQAGIETYGWDYGQTAIVCTVRHELPHENVAVENFLPNGPLATLPMTKQRSSVVWSEKTATANFLMALDEKDFTRALEDKIGPWLGAATLEGKRFSHPLSLQHARRYTSSRLALINEAAHGIHPIAGQGLNIGMRDIAALHAELTRASQLGLDLGNPDILQRYEKARKLDTGTMVLSLDLLVRLFSNAIPPVQAARRLGLGLVSLTPQVRRFFMRTAVG